MNYPFENLVFERGGIEGIGYVGALEYLETVKIYYQALKGLEICLQEQLQLLSSGFKREINNIWQTGRERILPNI
ncbi:hypothetical protein [Bacillus thuringiensis]|uniref:hypothetical protein n=1 Tax=Bacillus thuringiensis TaxID=1428 RepID=UPI000A387249|nr:hypothetical protein [Bacillus thuringiensis]MEC2709534.1 hypothetical protein [Bacillus thuringiensis]MED3179639.1 hypothetical protein [Bacillus thuringiensis]OTY05550.1 hypothetical protein BK734_22025 [Bacillus thuringiensis serovar kim]OUB14726.1 hypothetical protein BK733_24265 [Bacillus thuringiensis serovar xiaguangiensis]OUB69162.1 hypothetical protein BK765_19335 [Bacillus thuringiensis serovar dakota]